MLDNLTTSLSLIALQTQQNLPLLGIILLILWGLLFITTFIAPNLLRLGIIPRRWYGLMGIFTAPFLHADFNHLFFNTIPLLVLSNFILLDGLPYFLYITSLIGFISGFLTWCFGKFAIHIGASALVTGYWGFLISRVWTQGSITAIILGVLSLYYFGGIFLGIFPSKRGVSWEGHLFGLIAGVIASFLTTHPY